MPGMHSYDASDVMATRYGARRSGNKHVLETEAEYQTAEQPINWQ